MDPLNLIDLRKSPYTTLVSTSDGDFSRGVLLRRASFLADSLKCDPVEGVRGRAIVSLDSGPDFVSSVVGCWLAGTTPVLLDPLVKTELGRAVEQAGAGVVVSSKERATDDSGVESVVPSGGEAEFDDVPRVWDLAEPVVYLYTSGSTGSPALVPKTFEQLDVEVRFLSKLFGAPSPVATLVPWCHIYGFLFSLLLPARGEGIADISAGISPRLLAKASEKGGLIVAVPAVYKVMCRFFESGEIDPNTSCLYSSASAPLDSDLRERFERASGSRITDIYGSTEGGGIAYRTEDGPWLLQPHVKARVLEDEMLEIQSPSVSFPGEDGYYRVGDRVQLSGDRLELLGRGDDVVKIGGRRISLDEVTREIAVAPGVSDAVVDAVKVRGELRLVAHVVPEEGPVDRDLVLRHARSRLADHKVPRVVCEISEIPKTRSGKIDRQKLRELGGWAE